MNRDELLRYRRWLEEKVLWTAPQVNGHDDREHIRLTLIAIDNIDWRLETEPPREPPECGCPVPYRLHKHPCSRNHPCFDRKTAKRLTRAFLRDFQGGGAMIYQPPTVALKIGAF